MSMRLALTKALSKQNALRAFSTTSIRGERVCIVGANGGTGRPLSMLLKMNPKVTTLNLYDVANVAGIAADVSHIDTLSVVKPFTGRDSLDECLSCTNILVITGGEPENDKDSYSDLLKTNSKFMYDILNSAARNCPKAMILILTSPINSIVPFAAEVLKQHKVYDPKRLFGITHLCAMRARSIIADTIIRNPLKIKMQIIGGHSCETILPIISQCMPPLSLDSDEKQLLYDRIRKRNFEVIAAKEGKCGSQLAAACAANILCNSLFEAMSNRRGILATAYVSSTVVPHVPFFSSEFELDAGGVSKIRRMPLLNRVEQELFMEVQEQLKKDIKMGVEAAKKMEQSDDESDEC